MKPYIRILLLILLIPWLTGCWDQRELKEIRSETAEGFDLLENGRIRFTIAIPTFKSPSQSKAINVPVIGAEGRTINEAYLEIKKSVSQELDFGKTRLILINKRWATKGMYPALDSYYRESHSPINAKMAIVDDSASEVMRLKVEDRLMTSQYIFDLLQSGEDNGLIPPTSPYLIYSMFGGNGIDATIPIIKPMGSDRVKISGLALFHKKRMAGELDSNTSMYLMMLSKFKPHYFTVTEHVSALNADVSLFMERSKRKIEVTKEEGSVKAVINAEFDCDLVEVPFNIHVDDEMLKEIGSELEQKLNEKVKKVIKELQKANCDALGIGLETKAHHYRYWKTIQWDNVYPEMSIEPKIAVNIVNKGILE